MIIKKDIKEIEKALHLDEGSVKTEANNIKITATFRAPDWKDISVESCFTVTVNGALRKEERDDLIIKLAPDMAKLQGLPGYNVEVVSIEEDTE